MLAIVIVHPFGGYSRGDTITDAATIQAVISDRDHSGHYVRANLPDPAPERPAAKGKKSA